MNWFGFTNCEQLKEKIASSLPELINFYGGADKIYYLTTEKWEGRCKELLNSFTSQEGASPGIITFPNVKEEALIQPHQGQAWKKAMKTLKIWCENSSSNGTPALLIGNYDLKNHLSFSKIEADFPQRSPGILVYNPSQMTLLTIRIVEDCDQLKDEANYCVDEMKSLRVLLSCELESSGVTVAGLVVCAWESTYDQINYDDFKNFIVSHEIFHTIQDFNNFWEKDVLKGQCKKLNEQLHEGNKVRAFQAIASKILGYLSHFKLKVFAKCTLSTTKSHLAGSMKPVMMLLNYCQMQVAYSNHQRILLTGNHGTGKTVVILKRMELLCKDLKDQEVIYYVNSSGKSYLDLKVKQKIETNEKMRVIGSDNDLPNTIESDILPVEEKNGTERIHLFVDEYNLKCKSSGQDSRLCKILTEKTQFKNSFILIAAKPCYCFDGKEKGFSEKDHVPGDLENIMMPYNLKHNVRATREISVAAEITQAYIKSKLNEYMPFCVSQETISSATINQDRPPKKRLTVKIPSFFKKIFSKSEVNLSTRRLSKSEFNLSTLSSNMKSSSSSGFALKGSSSLTAIHKTSEITAEENKNNQGIVREYCLEENPRGISCSLPQLLILPDSYNHDEKVVLIGIFLIEILKLGQRRTAIIHFEAGNPIWLKNLICHSRFFPTLTITYDVREFLTNHISNLVLITNYDHVKGFEFSEVLLLLDKNESYNFIPDAILRCKTKLSILISPSNKEKHQSGNVVDLVNYWIVDYWTSLSPMNKTPIFKIVELALCSEQQCNGITNYEHRYSQSKERANPKDTYSVYKSSKLYKEIECFQATKESL